MNAYFAVYEFDDGGIVTWVDKAVNEDAFVESILAKEGKLIKRFANLDIEHGYGNNESLGIRKCNLRLKEYKKETG